MEVVIDTNFILTCLKNKVNFLDVLKFGKPVILSCVLDELKNFSHDERKKGKEKEFANIALGIIEKNRDIVKIVKREGKVDDEIVDYAKNKSVAVASLDKELRRRVKESGAKIINIVNKKKFILN